MKIIILAAGVGSRLDGKEDHLPKPLTQLANGKSILQLQLDALEEYLPLEQIYIVVGYQKEAIMAAFPDFFYIYNPLFEQENTAKSLLRALRKIDDDVLWLNGDVVFHPSILGKILRKGCTGMIVNQAPVAEEEVKYRTDEEGRILEVSKQVQHPQGEALGINYYAKADLPLLKQNLADCHPKDYFEKGIEKGIKSGQVVWSVPIASNECAEIDFPDDLLRANQLIKEWQL